MANTIVTPMVDAQVDSSYLALFHGSTYNFTDYSKIEDMHNGKTFDDTKKITVDSKEEHGSQLNPYVIDSVAAWNDFATAMNVEPNGKGKYFLLADDLDFAAQTFTPVAMFKGTFYGGGHSLKNISYSFASSGNCATFCAIDANATISDLNIVDATFTSVGNHNALVCALSSGGRILNCHASGSISTSTTVGGWIASGGILGVSDSTTATAIYRCSTSASITIMNSSNEGNGIGVIAGATHNGGQLVMLDCYGTMENQYSSNVDIYGGIAGMSYNAGDMRIENCVCDINYKHMESNGNGVNYHPSSLVSYWMAEQHPSNITVKNTYASGLAESKGVEYAINPDYHYTTQTAIANSIAIDIDNFNWYSLAGASKFVNPQQWVQSGISLSANSTMHDGNKNDFWDLARNDNALPSSIWTNRNVIGASSYFPSNSPIKNNSIVTQYTIKYVNLKNNNGVLTEIALGTDSSYSFKDTTQLYTPNEASNHKFVGWTTDKSGDREIFKNIPSNLYGNVTLYAVWDVPQASVTKEIIVSAESDGAFTKAYKQGSSLTMKGDIVVKGMTDSIIQRKWRKDGDTTILGTSSTYSISNVADSGDFVLDYIITDSIEPLWRHTGSTAVQHAEITVGQLEIKSFALNVTPYYGRPYGDGSNSDDATPVPVMQDKYGNVIAGKAPWDIA
ncbi:MAG: hypothetical protein K2N53_03945, partial [Clostridia bacterium]|nr:hypothetical protein [Clostridia bacterium]